MSSTRAEFSSQAYKRCVFCDGHTTSRWTGVWSISIKCLPNCLFLWTLNMVDTYEHVTSGAKHNL